MDITNTNKISTSIYLTKRLPDDVLLIIASFAGTSFAKLALLSKELNKSVNTMTDYFMSFNHTNTLLPLDTTALTSTILGLNPCYFTEWGYTRSTIEKELLFSEAIRTGSINTMKHIISLGVDLNAIRSTVPNENDPKNIRSVRFFPIQDAVSYNHPDKLRLLLAYGADLCPMSNYGRRFIMDGYEDLLSYTSDTRFGLEINEEIPEIILNEHIRRKEYSPFIMRHWRSDTRVFLWFCKALSSVPRGEKTGYGSNCQNLLCGRWCKNIRFCNWHILCETCSTITKGPAIQEINESNYIERLWVPPIHYIDDDEYNPFEDDDDTVRTWDTDDNYSNHERELYDDDTVITWDGDDEFLDTEEYFDYEGKRVREYR